jgi:hypothetical protein
MKVTGIGPSSSTAQSRRTEKGEAKKGEFARHLSDALGGADDAGGVEASAPLGAVDALLAAQMVGDATDREARRRMAQRGEDILDRLEEIRHGLLLGTLSKERLAGLAQLVRNRRDNIGDPRLAAVLDEIELRAEVELAKLSRR